MSDDDWFEHARREIESETHSNGDAESDTGTDTTTNPSTSGSGADTETPQGDHESQSVSGDTGLDATRPERPTEEAGFEFTDKSPGETVPSGREPGVDSVRGASDGTVTGESDTDGNPDSRPGRKSKTGVDTAGDQRRESATEAHSPADDDGIGSVEGETEAHSSADDDGMGSAEGETEAPDEFGFDNFERDEIGESGIGGAGELVDGSDPVGTENFESEIDRIKLGVEGLDEMIRGGIPRRSLITTIGSPGTGKTTFGIQFLDHALSSGDRGIYITLEESREAILSTAEGLGRPFREYEANGDLVIVGLDPVEMANSLSSIRDELTTLINEFDADRLVLDSVSLLEMMYDHPAERRSEVFGFTRSLKQAGVTSLLTSEASQNSPYASRHGIVEYLTDAVVILQYVRPSDFQETRMAVEIQKIRDASHSRGAKPYEITDNGLSVYRRANIF